MAYRTSAQVISDIVKVNLDVISNGYDHPDDNTVEFFYTNADWCDYYLVRIGDDSYVLPPGKTVIQHYSRSTPSAEVKQPGTYRPYKGIPVENLDIRFPYALPVKVGTEVTLLRDTRERVRSFVVLMKPGEPVCAMRGGRVCLNDVKGSVLISHKDNTFAAYANLSEVSVLEGQSVLPGDEIGICGENRLTISVFMLDANKIAGNKYAYTHFTPWFRTSEGDVKLELDKQYEAVLDPDLIYKDMPKAVRKRYLKSASK